MSLKTSNIQALSYADRAELPSISSLASYLLTLISIKRSNLALSADVHTTAELLELAETIGDYICVLKTHADIIDDFSERTIRGLQDVSKRKHFLIFEDRKFGDIGNTLQSQYTRGPLRIAHWAHLTNAHLLPGPSIISALYSAAQETLTTLNQTVATTITSGGSDPNLLEHAQPSIPSTNVPLTPDDDNEEEGLVLRHHRTNSFNATATTTISQTYESAAPPPPPRLLKSLSNPLSSGDTAEDVDIPSALAELGPPPQARGLLLLAQMSSEGNLATGEYTKACVEAAREYKNFVVGFICQESLNTGKEFVNFTPGVGLEDEGEGKEGKGDGKGQVWRTPEEVVGRDGVDVVIVGRGILKAKDRVAEAERFRRAAWRAYEGRLKR
ncbi:uncharacterized protein KY384_006625 [Bacidia gigantensis]|uniref:uncharacterized protein n=1 Tax=Bacidia gigantensis TaxID=2732470 RepID=UPI001D04AA0F|nr:uncharacterized protein KY384_006625 [Bacidia gigantensis]KAG8528936.1 hypothetical protein KY384_006625 [Bacidia gigantensis]